MFAVFRSGGKQHRVAKGDVVLLERLEGEAGDTVAFEEVLALGDDKTRTVGAPLVAGATVAGTIVEQTRGRKIIVFKKRRRKHSRRTNGHRQHLSVVRIDDILTGGRKPAAKAGAAAKPPAKKVAPKKAETKAGQTAKKAAPKKAAPKPSTAKKPAAKKSKE